MKYNVIIEEALNTDKVFNYFLYNGSHILDSTDITKKRYFFFLNDENYIQQNEMSFYIMDIPNEVMEKLEGIYDSESIIKIFDEYKNVPENKQNKRNLFSAKMQNTNTSSLITNYLFNTVYKIILESYSDKNYFYFSSNISEQSRVKFYKTFSKNIIKKNLNISEYFFGTVQDLKNKNLEPIDGIPLTDIVTKSRAYYYVFKVV